MAVVKFDVAHLILVCWVLSLQKLGAEHIEVKPISILFSCISSRDKVGRGFGDEQCWVILWTPNEVFGCIKSHAQSTAATSFTGEVKSHVVHLIMVCWELLLPSFGAEHIGHASLPINNFAHACVEVKFMSILFLGMNSAGWSYGPSLKTLAVLHHMHRAQLPHISPLR